MSELYLGIDGGGTKSEAVILDASGRLLGQAKAGPSNFNNVGVERALEGIGAAVSEAAKMAGVPAGPFTTAFLGIAGVVSKEDRAVVRHMAQRLDLAPDDRVGADHDCRIALAGGLAGDPGIVQIIGTGTSCFGITASGERWMAGGWGQLLADEGGGYWLGVQALKAATAAYDGRGGQTVLREMVQDALQMDGMDQIMQRVYTEQLSVSEIATLSRLVLAAARENDKVAVTIVATGMDEVARCVEVVAHRLGFPEDGLRLVCIGGVLRAGEVVTKPLADAIYRRLPHCRIEAPRFSPAVGAGLLALKMAPNAISAEIVANLSRKREQ